MKALLFLSLVGLAIYAGLLYTHDALSGNTPDRFATSTENPNRPAAQISSWASDLGSIRERPEIPQPARVAPPAMDVAAIAPATSTETVLAEPETIEPAVQKPARQSRAKAPVQVSNEFMTKPEMKRARMARRAERRRGFGLFRVGRIRD